ncbi:hypothetical protein D7X48_04675 [bacterium D16-50]|nr:hypothetical protein D7X48_04675 [bacterium D16-50]
MYKSVWTRSEQEKGEKKKNFTSKAAYLCGAALTLAEKVGIIRKNQGNGGEYGLRRRLHQ